MTKICFSTKLFRSLQHSLLKTFCLEVTDVWINLGKISTGRNRDLEGLARILTYIKVSSLYQFPTASSSLTQNH